MRVNNRFYSCVTEREKFKTFEHKFFHLKYETCFSTNQRLLFSYFEVIFYTCVQKKLGIIMQFIASMFISLYFSKWKYFCEFCPVYIITKGLQCFCSYPADLFILSLFKKGYGKTNLLT